MSTPLESVETPKGVLVSNFSTNVDHVITTQRNIMNLPPLKERPTERIWSKYQNAIFDFCLDPSAGNAIVIAVAGSGKSTTMVEALNRVIAADRILKEGACESELATIFLAFNKSIAEELKSKGVNGRTFHSLTYSPVTRYCKTKQVDADKLRKLIRQHLTTTTNGHSDEFIYGAFICRLVGLAKQCGFLSAICPKANKQVWIDLAEHHDLEIESEYGDFDHAIDLAMWLLDLNNNIAAHNLVDFDDLLYFPVLFNISLPKFDFIVVDEAQDTNAIQRALIRMIMRSHLSRLIAVGDSAQAIYGFRGSDSQSLAMIGKEFQCKSLPLTISYRCPVSVVKYAQQWVKHIEASPTAPDGEVVEVKEWTADGTTFRSDDLIVCRTTKPLVQLAYRMIKNRFPVRILGREIGQGLKSVISKMQATDIDDLEIKVDVWLQREVEKALNKHNEAKVQLLQDKADCILCLIGSLEENNRTVQALLNIIDSLFSDQANNAAVTLCTIHKGKGKEARRVWWLNRNSQPSKWARKPWAKEQELNICYVAATRAIESLFLIEDGNVSGAVKMSNKNFQKSLEDIFDEGHESHLTPDEPPPF